MLGWRGPGARGRGALAMVVALLGSIGCYRYTPVAVSELAPGMSVRVQLSAVAVDRLRTGDAARARLLDGFGLSGTVSRLAADSLSVAIPLSALERSDRTATGPRSAFEFGLMRSDVQSAELRRLDRMRTTWTTVALSVATVAAVLLAVERGGRSGGTTPPPGGPAESRMVPYLAPVPAPALGVRRRGGS